MLKSAISLYGGFKCDTWAHDDAIKPVVGKITESGYALDVQSVSGGFDIFDLEFGAGNGDDAFPNSIAARFVGTSGATLRRVKLTARDGLPGKNGGVGVAGSTVKQTDLGGAPLADSNGNPSTSTMAGSEKACKCPNAPATLDVTTGGTGSLTSATGGQPGSPAIPPSSAEDTGAGGTAGASNCIAAGGTGHNGARGCP